LSQDLGQKQEDAAVETFDLPQNENGYMALSFVGWLPEQLATSHLSSSNLEKEKMCKVATPLLAGASGFTPGLAFFRQRFSPSPFVPSPLTRRASSVPALPGMPQMGA
jgi:hypothetical protein